MPEGFDSVSDNCNHHFSRSDWMGIAPSAELPSCLRDVECGTDTVRGKYSPSETWTRNEGRVTVDVNVLADRGARRWAPGLSAFFGSGLDFESFRVRFSYDNVVKNSVSPVDLAGYSFDVESNGRGHKMFRFSRIDEPFSVSTHADVYIMDREYITVKEAKKWERHDFNADEIEMLEPVEAPDLPPSIQTLVDRIYKIDPEEIRLGLEPDRRLVGTNSGSRNFRIGNRGAVPVETDYGHHPYQIAQELQPQVGRIQEAMPSRQQIRGCLKIIVKQPLKMNTRLAVF